MRCTPGTPTTGESNDDDDYDDLAMPHASLLVSIYLIQISTAILIFSSVWLFLAYEDLATSFSSSFIPSMFPLMSNDTGDEVGCHGDVARSYMHIATPIRSCSLGLSLLLSAGSIRFLSLLFRVYLFPLCDYLEV